jgi:hypothetical protein
MIISRLLSRSLLSFVVAFLISRYFIAINQLLVTNGQAGVQGFAPESSLPAASVAETSPQEHSERAEGDDDEELALNDLIASTISKWNLSSTTNVQLLLKRIWDKELPYNNETDLAVFYHPIKSGGTTVSAILNGMGKVVPGSQASGYFSYNQLTWDYPTGARDFNNSIQQWWQHHKVLYSHDKFRPYSHHHAPIHHQKVNSNETTEPRQPTKLYKFLRDSLPPTKRIRHLTMVREPLNYVASNMNEWICNNYRYQRKAKKSFLPHALNQTHACYGYTLEQLTQVRIAANTKECLNQTEAQLQQQKSAWRRSICKTVLATNRLDDTPYCASTKAFLQHFPYRQRVLVMLDYYYNVHVTQKNIPTPPFQDIIEGVMEYLGGIDTFNSPDDDMLWFGITERLPESLCLLHYRLQIPWHEMPKERVQECRPTTFWTEESKQTFYASEPLLMDLHRAANAVLDVQVAKMKHEIRSRRGEVAANDTTRYPHVPASCYVP